MTSQNRRSTTTKVSDSDATKLEVETMVNELVESVPRLKAAKDALLAGKNGQPTIVEVALQRFKQRA